MDIDIDCKDRGIVRELFPSATDAFEQEGQKKHVAGVYFMDVPSHNGLCTIGHKDMEARGYLKIDLLSLRKPFELVRDREHMLELMKQEPQWDKLLDRNISSQLFQLDNHGRELEIIRPRNISDLAIAIAISRPGKVHLLEESMDVIRTEIWKPTEKYSYKKSHAFSYAALIILQLNSLTSASGE